MKYFYLELNPIIVAGSKLKNLNWSKAEVYTSSWAISEQLINLTAKNYSTIRSSFRLIKELGLRVDWENNMSKVFSAFYLKPPVLADEAAIKHLYEYVLEEDCYEKLESKKQSVLLKLKEIRNLSNWQMKLFNDHFTPEVKESMKNLSEKERWRNSVSFILLEFIKAYFDFSDAQLIARYTGRLDRYLKAQVNYIQKKKKYKVNDYFDLEHFKYLQNEITYMVSDDVFVHQLDCKKVYRVQEFIDYMRD